MNNVSKTIMTIAVAGSLLFGGAMSSQAADYFSTSQDSTDGQRGNQRSGELYGGPVGPDEKIPIPGEDDPLPGIDLCQATGKITGLHFIRNGTTELIIDHNTEDQHTKFHIHGGNNDFSHPLQSAIITEAWLRNLLVKVMSGQPCSVLGNGSIYGYSATAIQVLQAPTE